MKNYQPKIKKITKIMEALWSTPGFSNCSMPKRQVYPAQTGQVPPIPQPSPNTCRPIIFRPTIFEFIEKFLLKTIAFDHLQIIKNTKCDRFVFYHITEEALKHPLGPKLLPAKNVDVSWNGTKNSAGTPQRNQSFGQTVKQKCCLCFYRTVKVPNGNYQALTPE
jgi:hypothetical protein